MPTVLAIDYRWWVFIHLVGVLGFMLAHGVSVTVLYRVRKERDREQIRSLLQLSGSTIVSMYVSLGLLMLGGVVAGFQGHWWSQKWIRISLGVLIAITGVMSAIARPYYQGIKDAIALRPSGAPRVSDEDLAARLAGPRPLLIAWTGFAGLGAILWLMVFKPV